MNQIRKKTKVMMQVPFPKLNFGAPECKRSQIGMNFCEGMILKKLKIIYKNSKVMKDPTNEEKKAFQS